MLTKVLLGAALAVAALPVAAHAEDKPFTLQDAIGSDDFKLKGSERIRYESYDNNFRPSGPRSADLLTFRTVVEAEYRGKGFRVGGELRDVRGYLADASTPFSNADVDPAELVQLYAGVSLGDALGAGSKAELTGGRFLLNFGSKRLVGDPGFLSTANGFTGLRLDWTGKAKQALTLFYTLPQQRLPDDKQGLLDNRLVWDHEGTDLRFWGGFLALPKGAFGLATELYAFGLDEDDRPGKPTRNRHIVTPGFRIYSPKAAGKFDTEIEAAYQFGRIRTSSADTAPSVPVSAYTAHAELGYTARGGWKPRVALLGEIASGDHAGSRSYNRFDSLYGPRFTDWGPTGLFGALARSNIVAIGLKGEIKPDKHFDMMLQWHDAWLDSATDSFAKSGLVDATGGSGRHAGQQFDGRMRFYLKPKQIELHLGGAYLIRQGFLRDAPKAPAWGDSYHGYADLIFWF